MNHDSPLTTPTTLTSPAGPRVSWAGLGRDLAQRMDPDRDRSRHGAGGRPAEDEITACSILDV